MMMRDLRGRLGQLALCSRQMVKIAIATFAGAAAAAGAHAADPVLSCEAVAHAALPHAEITKAAVVEAGQWAPPQQKFSLFSAFNFTGKLQQGTNPGFCRVAAILRPTPSSSIKVEVWMPLTGWNGKFLGVGNFGWAGQIMFDGLLSGIQTGYAVAGTDTGHDSSLPDGGGGKWSLNAPEKLVDYAYRADHEMTVQAKAFIRAFYGAGPTKSYWIGCSLGGLEGLIEAKRYPADYDGIVTGAPPNPIVSFNALQIWPAWLIGQDSRRFIPEAKYQMIHDAVVAACATPVGRKDNLVDDPERCGFDPAALRCAHEDRPDCLTEQQVYLLRETYAGPLDPKTGKRIFPGPARGSELGMFIFAGMSPMSVALDMFRYAALQDPSWDGKTIDWHADIARASAKIGPLMDVAPADLKPFLDRGGKLLMYVGWTDYHNGAELASFYQKTLQAAGPAKANSVRLFLIPGMDHCFGGKGCDTFNKLGAIDQWSTSASAPQELLASKLEGGAVVRTRPICAYPKVVRYRGQGDVTKAESFTCN